MGFTLRTGTLRGNSGGGGQTLSYTMLTAPQTGDVICISVGSFFTSSGTNPGTLSATCGGQSFTWTNNSPNTAGGSAGANGSGLIYLGYILNFTGSGGVVNISTSGAASDFVIYESGAAAFIPSGGVIPIFDKDASGYTASSATPVNTPSISPTNIGSLLYESAICGDVGSGVGGPWSPAYGDSNFQDGYILSSASGSTAANITDPTSPDRWTSMIMAIFGEPKSLIGSTIQSQRVNYGSLDQISNTRIRGGG